MVTGPLLPSVSSPAVEGQVRNPSPWGRAHHCSLCLLWEPLGWMGLSRSFLLCLDWQPHFLNRCCFGHPIAVRPNREGGLPTRPSLVPAPVLQATISSGPGCLPGHPICPPRKLDGVCGAVAGLAGAGAAP